MNIASDVERVRCAIVDIRSDAKAAYNMWESHCKDVDHSYYVSPGWVESWCETIPDAYKPYITIVYKDDIPACMCILTYAVKWRQGIVPNRVVNLYSSGVVEIDNIAGICNQFIPLSDARIPISDIVNALPFPWDEVCCPGFSLDDYPGNTFAQYDKKWTIYDYNKPNYYVDLRRIGTTMDSYLAALTANARHQIKRAIRIYEQFGPIHVEEPANTTEAFEMLNELYALCNARKNEKGIVSSLNSHFMKFHKVLVKNRFKAKEIQILKFSAGSHVIGYTYNQVYNDIVHYYQCGFNYESDNKIKPGLVCHVAAIIYNLKLGHKVYDFGPGMERFKQSLSNGQTRMVWVRLLRPSLKMFMFKYFKSLKERMKHVLMSRGGKSR